MKFEIHNKKRLEGIHIFLYCTSGLGKGKKIAAIKSVYNSMYTGGFLPETNKLFMLEQQQDTWDSL